MKVFSFTLFFTLFLLSCRNSNPNLPGGGGGGGRDATSNLDWNKASQASLEERVKTLAKSLSFHSPADTALEKRSPKAARITQDADLQVSWDDSEIKDLSKAKKHANENFLPRTGFLPPGSSEHLPATYLIEYKVISRKKSTPVFAIQCNNPQTPAHCTLVIDKKEQPQGGGQRDKTNEIQATITAQYEVPQPTAQNSPEERQNLSTAKTYSATETGTQLKYTIKVSHKALSEAEQAIIRAKQELNKKIESYADGSKEFKYEDVKNNFRLPTKVTEQHVTLVWGEPYLEWNSPGLEASDFKTFSFDSKSGLVTLKPMQRITSKTRNTTDKTFTVTFTFSYELIYKNEDDIAAGSGELIFKTIVENRAYNRN